MNTHTRSAILALLGVVTFCAGSASAFAQRLSIGDLQSQIAPLQAGHLAQAAWINEQAPLIVTLQAENLAQAAQIATLQTENAAQATQVTNLQANNIPGLASYVSVDTSTPSRPAVRVTAANLQVVNGEGLTGILNGLGNIIVGYDQQDDTWVDAMCSWSFLGDDEATCINNGGVWATHFKTGSHNLVIGDKHNYGAYGGLVVGGWGNTIRRGNATVTGGSYNIASGLNSSISGGFNHNVGDLDDWQAGALFQEQ